MAFIDENFLLDTGTAQALYHEYAVRQPIIDYHCHLPPRDLAENRRFNNLHEIWLEGDHYKWRAMRIAGEPESVCTGDAHPREKFLAFARTVPKLIRNPLHHWTHLELKRYFGIDDFLNEETAPAIWEATENLLASDDLSVWGILRKFHVRVIGTTDDPTDDLGWHAKAAEAGCPARVVPSFRPDKGILAGKVDAWNSWVDRLAAVDGSACSDLPAFLEALGRRINHFAAHGCRASDHGLERCPEAIATEAGAAATFATLRKGEAVPPAEADAFAGFLLVHLGERYAEQGWAMQLHLGAARNVNAGLFAALGPDVGGDSIDDQLQVRGLRTILGELSARGKLPKTILYNLNPAWNYAFATMAGNFAGDGIPGKVQFGSGWWFLDQLEGMTWQLNALSNLGLLSTFIGMLTDSRSFMSFPRHEYFRRLLCALLGRDAEAGLVPADKALLGKMVADIAYGNARDYFGFAG